MIPRAPCDNAVWPSGLEHREKPDAPRTHDQDAPNSFNILERDPEDQEPLCDDDEEQT